MLLNLPDNSLTFILNYLPDSDLSSLAQTSHHLARFLRLSDYWAQRLAFREGINWICGEARVWAQRLRKLGLPDKSLNRLRFSTDDSPPSSIYSLWSFEDRKLAIEEESEDGYFPCFWQSLEEGEDEITRYLLRFFDPIEDEGAGIPSIVAYFLGVYGRDEFFREFSEITQLDFAPFEVYQSILEEYLGGIIERGFLEIFQKWFSDEFELLESHFWKICLRIAVRWNQVGITEFLIEQGVSDLEALVFKAAREGQEEVWELLKRISLEGSNSEGVWGGALMGSVLGRRFNLSREILERGEVGWDARFEIKRLGLVSEDLPLIDFLLRQGLLSSTELIRNVVGRERFAFLQKLRDHLGASFPSHSPCSFSWEAVIDTWPPISSEDTKEDPQIHYLESLLTPEIKLEELLLIAIARVRIDIFNFLLSRLPQRPAWMTQLSIQRPEIHTKIIQALALAFEKDWKSIRDYLLSLDRESDSQWVFDLALVAGLEANHPKSIRWALKLGAHFHPDLLELVPGKKDESLNGLITIIEHSKQNHLFEPILAKIISLGNSRTLGTLLCRYSQYVPSPGLSVLLFRKETLLKVFAEQSGQPAFNQVLNELLFGGNSQALGWFLDGTPQWKLESFRKRAEVLGHRELVERLKKTGF